jgi:predicted enzyme related to lactoylglutathione lyase
MPIATWNFIKIYVQDLESMISFYTEAFDFHVDIRLASDEFEEVLLSQPEGTSHFGLLRWADRRHQGAQPVVGVIGMMTADAEQAVSVALAHGARLKHAPFEVEGAVVAFVSDPEGNEIEFVQPT